MVVIGTLIVHFHFCCIAVIVRSYVFVQVIISCCSHLNIICYSLLVIHSWTVYKVRRNEATLFTGVENVSVLCLNPVEIDAASLHVWR